MRISSDSPGFAGNARLTAEAASKISWLPVVAPTRSRPRLDRFALTPDKLRHDRGMTRRRGPRLRPRANPNHPRLRFCDALVNGWWTPRGPSTIYCGKHRIPGG